MIHLSSYHSNGLPTVVWSNKVNLIGEKVYKPKIHFCEQCNKPILIYGRLIPCKHVFCFSCATLCLHQGSQTLQQSQGCHRCGGKALRVERNTLNSIFVCQVDSCRRTYLSARDLQAHVTHRHSRNKFSNDAGASSASMQAISSSPYISSSTLQLLNNSHNSQQGSNNHRQSASSSSTVNNNNNNSPIDHHHRRDRSSHHHQPNHNQNHKQQHGGGRERNDRDRSRDRDRVRDRDRDRDRYNRNRDNYRDRDRDRDSKEYHRQSLQRAAQWAEASAQMLEKGLTR